jgi:hypothetical protein
MRQILTMVLLTAALVMAADATGDWSGTFTPEGDGPQSVYLVLHQSGDQLTGSGGPGAAQQFPIQSGKVQGDRLTFEVVAGKGMFVFDLKMAGDLITGDVQLRAPDQTANAKVLMKRAAEAPVR